MKSQNPHQYAEIVTNDCYHLKRVDFVPTTIYDIGANIGMFSWYAASIWPNAQIIAVEPHSRTFRTLMQNVASCPNVKCIEAALGKPPIRFEGEQVDSGHHWFGITVHDNGVVTDIPAVMLQDLPSPSGKLLVKIDCEGGEHALVDDMLSTQILEAADYVTMELHFWWDALVDSFLPWLYRFRKTHVVDIHVAPGEGLVWMRKV